ncbi:hypothetical protein DWF00_21665 [Bosea caraganae]|uniref:DUF2946 domain-containing protein n=1 Tax=Bosea caraganae TaxID=2763117 RepID=A0A370L664_9HYPH|nr:hypothetical protein [Bosea caraganae]RDJ23248.1 hypothetical protein DWF00_21665 [Bosea caraganae]RDJ24638.1 hypothetical protein DWE98_13230 [Bosea caraganae]
MQAAGWKRGAVALLCTYALILHAVLLALGSGLAAAPSPLPQHVLCLPSGGSGPDTQQGKSEHGPICCALGCLASANGVPPVAGTALPLRLARVAEARFLPHAAPAVPPGRPVYPLGARAPPALT